MQSQQSYQQRRQNVQGLLSSLDYKEKSSVEIQILQLLHQIHSLKPCVDNYVYNDGKQEQLFKLEGTIPIQYRSNQYNIPVAIWIPKNFPSQCPICYVTPVANMKIKQKHMHVDNQGLIYHPYLHNWKPLQSILVDLVGVLCSVFGKDPPLYASKQKGPSNNVNVNAQHHSKPQVSPAINNHYPAHHQSQQPQQPPSQHHHHQQKPARQSVVQNESEQKDFRSELEQKVKAALQKIYDKENEQLNSLAAAQRQLENHQKTIRQIRENQSKERDQLLQRRQNLQIKAEAMEQWLAKNEENEVVVANEVVVPSDLWSAQCIEATATVFAITDAMLELDQCLEDETIKLGTYLKQMSKLAREQFHAKALAKAVFEKQSRLVEMNQR